MLLTHWAGQLEIRVKLVWGAQWGPPGRCSACCCRIRICVVAGVSSASFPLVSDAAQLEVLVLVP